MGSCWGKQEGLEVERDGSSKGGFLSEKGHCEISPVDVGIDFMKLGET